MLGFFYLWSCKDIFFFKYSGILKRLSYFCSIFCEEKKIKYVVDILFVYYMYYVMFYLIMIFLF